jgi:erythritol transport system permease protein
VAYFGIMVPNFLSMANLVIMVKHVVIYAFLAIGMTFVIITGGIDLSVEAVVGLAGMVAGGLIHEGLHLPMVIFPHPDGRGHLRDAQRLSHHPL